MKETDATRTSSSTHLPDLQNPAKGL